MTLLNYIKKFGRSDLAKSIGTSEAYISQLAHGHRDASADMAMEIEEATNGLVTCEELRPTAKWHVVRGRIPTAA